MPINHTSWMSLASNKMLGKTRLKILCKKINKLKLNENMKNFGDFFCGIFLLNWQ